MMDHTDGPHRFVPATDLTVSIDPDYYEDGYLHALAEQIERNGIDQSIVVVDGRVVAGYELVLAARTRDMSVPVIYIDDALTDLHDG